MEAPSLETQPASKHIETYLNDHLAGSVAALEILDRLEKAHAGTELGAFFAGLNRDITADRDELLALMKRLGTGKSAPRRVVAWFAEKLTELKLRLDDPADGALRLLESLEGLSVGIEGKRLLWRSLATVSEQDRSLQGPDYPRLERCAEEQRQRIEPRRLQAAKEAFLLERRKTNDEGLMTNV
ncbi:MAG: hypothetical protein K2R98_10770 [Gemmataceae bacterium]|nr:hypothetical protein [Gemmataceae bacterium]